MLLHHHSIGVGNVIDKPSACKPHADVVQERQTNSLCMHAAQQQVCTRYNDCQASVMEAAVSTSSVMIFPQNRFQASTLAPALCTGCLCVTPRSIMVSDGQHPHNTFLSVFPIAVASCTECCSIPSSFCCSAGERTVRSGCGIWSPKTARRCSR